MVRKVLNISEELWFKLAEIKLYKKFKRYEDVLEYLLRNQKKK
jgi:hypothetical protein